MNTKLKIWKTIEVGALPVGGLLSELEKNDCYVSLYAKELIEKMSLSRIEKIDLVKMTVEELGFTKLVTWAQILERVKELGDVCPPEVGPLLRLEDMKQEKGSWYYIAMEPIAVSVGYPGVFCIERHGDGERWLGARWVSPAGEWDLGRGLVFRLRKKSSSTQSLPLNPLTLTLEQRVADLEAWRTKVERSVKELLPKKEYGWVRARNIMMWVDAKLWCRDGVHHWRYLGESHGYYGKKWCGSDNCFKCKNCGLESHD